jgi:hypothetical protein
MNFKDALDEVKDKAMWPFNWAEVKAELETDNVSLSRPCSQASFAYISKFILYPIPSA